MQTSRIPDLQPSGSKPSQQSSQNPLESCHTASGATPSSRKLALEQIVIRPFRSEDAGAFFSLNEAWISHWFVLEPEDLDMLKDPQTHVLAQGGRIYVADSGDEVVGCFALLPKPGGVLRLARMAVREDLRGQGLGRMLLLHAIATARALEAPRLVLETSRKLASAVHLYEATGFRYVDPDPDQPALARADLYMELLLNDG